MSAEFEKGTYVRYGTSGVCLIDDIRPMTMPGTGTGTDYYVLRPAVNDNSVIYVPVNNEKITAVMIPVLSVEEVRSIIRSTAENSLPWIEDRKCRAEQQREILRRCDRRELLRLISCIYLRKRELAESGRKLAGSDENVLRQAEKLVNNELTFVLGIEESQVGGYIRCLLEEE